MLIFPADERHMKFAQRGTPKTMAEGLSLCQPLTRLVILTLVLIETKTSPGPCQPCNGDPPQDCANLLQGVQYSEIAIAKRPWLILSWQRERFVSFICKHTSQFDTQCTMPLRDLNNVPAAKAGMIVDGWLGIVYYACCLTSCSMQLWIKQHRLCFSQRWWEAWVWRWECSLTRKSR